jgi:hypothetical protein
MDSGWLLYTMRAIPASEGGLIDSLAQRRNFYLVSLNGIRVWSEGFDQRLFRPYQIAWIFFRVSTRAQHKAPQK